MKKLFTLLFLAAFSLTVVAQNIEIKGIVKDIVSSEVLGYTNITTADKQFSTVSNADGAFILSCPQNTKSIALSYIAYATLEVPVNALPKDGIYNLDVENTVLEEIVVTNQPIDKYIENLVENSIKHITVPLLLSTYYREFTKVNENYTKFSDALIDYTTNRKKKDIDTELVVKQSRAVRLPGAEQETIDLMTGFDVRKSVSRDCNFYAVEAVLSGKEYKNYNIAIKAVKGGDGAPLHIISIVPKPEVQELLYGGTISYDPEKNLILEINFALAESHKQYSKERNFLVIKAKLKDNIYRSAFRIVNGEYMLHLSSRFGTVYIRNKKRFDDDLTFKSDLIVTNFSHDMTTFDKKEKYRERSLYARGSDYTEKFWLKNNSIVLTNEEEAIIKSLQEKQ